MRMMRTVGTAVWGSEENVSSMSDELERMAGFEKARKRRSRALVIVEEAVTALGGKVNHG